MKTAFFIAIALLLTGTTAFAQKGNPFVNNTPEYTKTVKERANKIVSTLGITDSAKYNRVLSIMAEQSRYLSALHDFKDDLLKFAKSLPDKDARTTAINDSAQAQLYIGHAHFVALLASELTLEQIEAVKNGMTYNVMNNTYNGYLDMIQRLTEEQKRYIYTALYEAREQAIDQSSSNAKHAVFGKYKGRINNYLSAQGYDMKAESKAWEERINKK
jgi:autonomous glycyl radical cofactor GrcA